MVVYPIYILDPIPREPLHPNIIVVRLVPTRVAHPVRPALGALGIPHDGQHHRLGRLELTRWDRGGRQDKTRWDGRCRLDKSLDKRLIRTGQDRVDKRQGRPQLDRRHGDARHTRPATAE